VYYYTEFEFEWGSSSMFKSIRFLALICLLACTPAFAAGSAIAGTWNLTADTADGEMRWTMVVKDDGGKLSGTASASQGDYTLEEPRLDGNEFSFKITLEDAVYRVSMVIDGSRVSGKWNGPSDRGKISGTKRP